MELLRVIRVWDVRSAVTTVCNRLHGTKTMWCTNPPRSRLCHPNVDRPHCSAYFGRYLICHEPLPCAILAFESQQLSCEPKALPLVPPVFPVTLPHSQPGGVKTKLK